MRLEQLVPILQAASLGTPGTDLFIHYMPPEAIAGTLLLPSLSGSPISFETPGWRRDVGFQAITRAPKLADALARGRRVFKALTITQRRLLPAIGDEIPAILLSYVRPLQDPQPYPRLLNNSWEVSTNFFAAYAVQGEL